MVEKSSTYEWEEVGCLLCGRKTETQVVWSDASRGNIVRCRICGQVFRNPRRKEERSKQHFTEEWTEAHPAFILEEYRTKNLSKIVSWILNRFTQPGAILDIGSSYGNLLGQFPETWMRYGIEPSQTACQISQTRLPGAQIINGTLSDAKLLEKTFDAITIVDMIDYLHEPLRDFRELPRLLKPGGLVLIEAQNFANRGKVYRWLNHPFDDTWMYFYTPKTLEELLNRIGMKVVADFYLPGHRIGSTNKLAQVIARAEFGFTKMLRKLSRGLLDIIPHFVLVAQPITSKFE